MAFIFHYQEPPSEGLKAYAQSLYQRRHEAAPVPRVEVAVGNWTPTANMCHENAVQWCELNPDHQVVRGWLYFELPGLPYCRFTSHSVVRAPDGSLMDITPTAVVATYPFMIAGLDEDEYAEAAGALFQFLGTGDLDCWHRQGTPPL